MPAKKDKYRSVRLPEELVEEVERFIKDNPKQGFKSKAAFIKDAIRHRLENT